jgi:hypothetical protein
MYADGLTASSTGASPVVAASVEPLFGSRQEVHVEEVRRLIVGRDLVID